MEKRAPLAERMRPAKLNEVVGQAHLLDDAKILSQIINNRQPVSLILWGPPGSGKTTLARILAGEVEAEFIELSAVTSGKKDVEKVIEHARQNWNLQLRTILFVDEIHRFNKAQQDAFLPHVESGLITLVGATTENPSFEIISPLLSRSRVLVLNKLTDDEIEAILKRALTQEKKTKFIDKTALSYIAKLSDGDARRALGTLELSLGLGKKKVNIKDVEIAAGKTIPNYDKNGEVHYDVVSAFIKSMRGSNIDASLYYLTRMINAGEDPKFIARRMIVFASEDIGLAGNGALALAVAAFEAVERVGLPEAKYALYHAATALAKSSKSREIADRMHTAEDLTSHFPNANVPIHLRNAPTGLMKNLGYGKDYKWKADFKHKKGFLPEEVSKYIDKN